MIPNYGNLFHWTHSEGLHKLSKVKPQREQVTNSSIQPPLPRTHIKKTKSLPKAHSVSNTTNTYWCRLFQSLSISRCAECPDPQARKILRKLQHQFWYCSVNYYSSKFVINKRRFDHQCMIIHWWWLTVKKPKHHEWLTQRNQATCEQLPNIPEYLYTEEHRLTKFWLHSS